MTAPSQAARFCSCSAAPAHISESVTFSVGRTQGRADTESLESTTTSDVETAGGRFCTCSDVPTGLRADSDESGVVSPETQHIENVPSGQSATVFATQLQTGVEARVSEADIPELNSLTDLLPGETALFSAFTHGQDGSEAVLTDRRVVFKGAPDAAMLFSSIRLIDVDSVSISRSRPRRRSLIWGLIGIAASVGMWQALDGVGNLRLIIATIVLLMSVVLLADYALRPPDLEVLIRAKSGTVLSIDFAQSRAEDADRFAARVTAALEALRIV